jgi:hypothetical protein
MILPRQQRGGTRAPNGADDDGPSAASVVANTVSSGVNSIRAGVVKFSLAPKAASQQAAYPNSF